MYWSVPSLLFFPPFLLSFLSQMNHGTHGQSLSMCNVLVRSGHNPLLNHGRIDITTVKLCSKYWTFALPRPGDWKAIRAVPPKLEEPAGRYFIHCIQHWILRDPKTNPFKTMKPCDVYQETILVDSHGQIYKIIAYPNMKDDWGVRYFTITPNDSYMPLSLSQIEAVKDVRIVEAEGWEGLPSKGPFACKRIEAAIKEAVEVEVEPDPLAAEGIFEEVGQRPLQVKPVEDIVEEKYLISDADQRKLCNAYIHAQHGTDEQRKDGIDFLRRVLKRQMHKNAWPRIDRMTRTMLAHRIAKRFEIEFPSAQEKKEREEPKPVVYGYRLY